MDDNLFNNNKSNLIYMRGKAWSSLQNIIDSEDSEENESALNENANGYLSPINGLTNGESDNQYTKIKFNSFKSNISSDTSKLSKEDMDLYGYRPAWDQFYLVVCEQCKQVIKPQALKKHYDLRHKDTKNNLNDLNLNRKNFLEIKNENSDDSNLNSIDNNSNLRNILSSRNLLTKDDIDLERMKNNKNNDKLKTNFRNLNNKSSSNSTFSSSVTNNDTNTVKKSTRTKLLPCKDRKYDPDKHCGVRLTEQDSPCTRSLTCKTHSLTLRRSVLGRSKIFDDLLSEHRLAKEASLRAAGIEIKPTKLQLKQQQRLQKNKELMNKETQMISSPIHIKLFQSPMQSSLNNSNNKSQPSNSQNSLPSQGNNLNSNNNFNSLPTNNTTALHIQSPTAVIKSLNKFPSNSPPNQNTKNKRHLEKLLQTPPQHISKEFNSITNNLNKNATNTSSLVPQMQPISQIRFHHLNHQNHVSKPKINEPISYSTFSTNYLSCSPETSNLINVHCDSKQYNCDKTNSKNSSLNNYPKPAALCTFNARRLCIQSETANGLNEIFSSRVFNRKQDYTYSALSVFRKREIPCSNNLNNSQSNETSNLVALTPKPSETVSSLVKPAIESKFQNSHSIETYHISSNNSFSNNLIDGDSNLINSQSDSNHSISGSLNRNEDIKIKPNNFINFGNVDSTISYSNPLVNEISKNNIVNTYSNNLFSLSNK